MVDLIPRFYDVVEGGIYLDGNDIRHYRIHDLRAQMGNVNQEAILFNDSFFNNIAFGVENATMEQVIEAAKIANAHEFIVSSEQGYETNIGDRGCKLSGGQRQRLSIARAILKNPPILILDEATSALDTESERLVQDAIENLMRNRTSIVIAHRLSTVQNADRIIVLHRGRILAEVAFRQLDDLHMNARFLKVESEHSAMAACIGAATGGVRVFTATSSHGLAYMHEMLHWASRPLLVVAAAALLTSQAQSSGGPDWDILQATSPDGSAMVVYAYQEDEAVEKVNVRPTSLKPAATYTVNSVDVGLLGTATGAEIMANGIDVVESPVSAAHILTFTLTP